jgi:ABC-type transport system involved in multi-copper enzyme maturation permease subunit
MLRLARRGQANRTRLLVLLCVFAASIIFPIVWFSQIDIRDIFFGVRRTVSIAEEAKFASYFSLALVEAVLLAVAILAPAFAAGAIAEEKERQTLPMLNVSFLSDHEIILGKAFGRFGVIMAGAFSIAPVLAFTMMLGGVSPRFLVASAVLTFCTGATAIAIGIESACFTSGLRPALFRAYALAFLLIFGLFGPLFFLTPFSVLHKVQTIIFNRQQLAILVGGFAATHLVVTSIFLARAIRRFGKERSPARRKRRHSSRPHRHRVHIPMPLPGPKRYSRSAMREHLDPIRNAYKAPPRTRPWIDEDEPVLWKERYVSGMKGSKAMTGIGRATLVVSGLLCFMSVFVGAAEIMHETNWRLPATLAARESLVRGASFALGLFAVPAALRLAPTISRERQRRTLDALLMLPIERSALLWFKTRASIESSWTWIGLAVPASAWAYLSAGNWMLGLLAGLAVVAGAFFVVAIGAVLSVSCSSEVRAFRILMPAVAIVVGLPTATFYFTDWRDTGNTMMILIVASSIMLLFGVIAWRNAYERLQAIS